MSGGFALHFVRVLLLFLILSSPVFGEESDVPENFEAEPAETIESPMETTFSYREKHESTGEGRGPTRRFGSYDRLRANLVAGFTLLGQRYLNGEGSSNRVSFLGGVDFSGLVSRWFGFFVEAQYGTRDLGGASALAFVDLPAGIMIGFQRARYRGKRERYSVYYLKLGSYYALPMEESSGSQGFFGLYGNFVGYRNINKSFSYGVSLWGKYGLASPLSASTDTRTLEVGLSLLFGLG